MEDLKGTRTLHMLILVRITWADSSELSLALCRRTGCESNDDLVRGAAMVCSTADLLSLERPSKSRDGDDEQTRGARPSRICCGLILRRQLLALLHERVWEAQRRKVPLSEKVRERLGTHGSPCRRRGRRASASSRPWDPVGPCPKLTPHGSPHG